MLLLKRAEQVPRRAACPAWVDRVTGERWNWTRPDQASLWLVLAQLPCKIRIRIARNSQQEAVAPFASIV